jgi:hypothetical protein
MAEQINPEWIPEYLHRLEIEGFGPDLLSKHHIVEYKPQPEITEGEQ